MDEAVIAPTRRKLNVDEYYRMADAGILSWDDRVELIDGGLFEMVPIGTGHAANVSSLSEAFFAACAGRAAVRVQLPVRLDRFNEPQPDLAIVRRRTDSYAEAHPGPEDVLLLVEVANTSLQFDRTVKLPLYARAGIPELWILNMKQRVMEAYRKPAGSAYTELARYNGSATVVLDQAPDIAIQLGALYG